MSSYNEYPNNGKVLPAAIISLSVVIAFVLLLHAYARWLLRRRVVVVDVIRLPPPPLLHRRTLTAISHGQSIPVDEGLDPKVVALLPVFTYKVEQFGAGTDCVICLSVMEEGEKGRVLPRCNHRFHVECIDMWLMSHSTCPICRAVVMLEEPVAMDDIAAHVALRLEADEGVVVAAGAVEGEVSVASSSSSSSSSFLGGSLKRMLSSSRSESRVFPSANVNCNVPVS